ncbi:kinetochore protein NUF2 homolog [Miscanthus floridulus]|uniref:kinetochore protein NUF2 homolog n=1 Tax=Miscanthus floridulus TaxID=154761 RepID=UPI0034578EF9
MASSYSFPLFEPAEIEAALHSHGIAPSTSLYAEDIVHPQPGFVAEPRARPAATVQALQVVDNPEHHMRALRLSRIYKRANAFLQSIQFRDLNLRDLLRADGPCVVLILNALINFLLFRRDKLALLEPIVQEYGALDKRQREVRAKIDEVAFPSSSFTFSCLLYGEILRFSLPVCVFFLAFCSLPFSTLYSLARRKRNICLGSSWRHPWSTSSRRRSMPSSRGFMITTESSCRCALHQKPWTKREKRR